jgi:hypothetical protein
MTGHSVDPSPAAAGSAMGSALHPNELDLCRIARALQRRRRYRYVDPAVLPAECGYLVRAPCCSRTVDTEGGVIDIALLRWRDDPAGWSLFRRDHAGARWIADSRFARLPELFERLNSDPDRMFWQ